MLDASIASLFDLTGKAALVTGGAKGIGRGVAELLAQAGADVAIVDPDGTEAELVARGLKHGSQRALAVTADVSDEAAVRGLVDQMAKEFGRIDILVNNAGIFPRKPLRELDLETWERTIGVNLRGPYLTTRYAAEHMISGGRGGRIVNISSINSLRTYLGMAHYDASKAGLNALTRASALEYAPFNITVNTVAPGAVKTPGSIVIRTELGGGDPAVADEAFAQRIPLGRWAEPAEIARAVLLFVSDASAYVTGQTVFVDGGLMAAV
jgi:NAD(P)-dependent dehydrogenase (short-subunit alcohol dehydrogenase family)